MPGTLTIVHDEILLQGDAPFDVPDMDLGFARFLLELQPIARSPAVATLSMTAAVVTAMGTSGALYGVLSEAARLELVNVCSAEPRYLARLRYLLTNFAVFAHPDTQRWPVPANDQVLEEALVNIQPIGSILCMTDGSRYVCQNAGDYSDLRTFAEWRALFEISVPEYLDNLGTQEIHRLSRAVQLATVENPTAPIEITYMRPTPDGLGEVGRMSFRQYLPDQITAYCERHALTITSCPTSEPNESR